MAPKPCVLVALLTAATLLAGCADPPSPPFVESPPLPVLADFAACPHEYPDGQPVPCGDDNSVASHALSLAGWTCLDMRQDTGTTLWLWRNDNGSLAVSHDVQAAANESVLVHADVVTRAQAARVVSQGSATGGARFDGTHGTAGTWGAVVRTMSHESPTPELANATRSLMVTEFDGQPWYVWRLETANATYDFQRMGTITVGGRFVSVPIPFRDEGQDFQLDGLVTEHLRFSGAAFDAERATGTACPDAA